MPTFHVYHARPANFSFLQEEEQRRRVVAFPDGYVKVATVKGDHIEDAYRATQNFPRSWVQNADVMAVEEVKAREDGTRSTMLGDIISIEDHEPFVVDLLGCLPLSGLIAAVPMNRKRSVILGWENDITRD